MEKFCLMGYLQLLNYSEVVIGDCLCVCISAEYVADAIDQCLSDHLLIHRVQD